MYIKQFQGDIGTILICDKQPIKKAKLAGIASLLPEKKCDDFKIPARFTNVSYMKYWIDEIMKKAKNNNG